MPEPIPDTAPATAPEITADAALIALIRLLYTDPLAAPLTEDPGFFLHRDLSIRYSDRERGSKQIAAARALLGGAVSEETSYSADTIRQVLTTTWQGLPLNVYVDIAREDEVAELRKQLAEARAAAGQAVAE